MLKDGQRNSSQEDEDGTYQKYESPKFFVGSGSPVRKQSLQAQNNDQSGPEEESKSSSQKAGSQQFKQTSTQQKSSSMKKKKNSEVEQHFSFQRTQLLTDQSHEEEEDVDFTGALAETDNHNLTGDLMSED